MNTTYEEVDGEEGGGVGKGAKYGLALIGLLAIVLVGVLIVRYGGPGEKTVASGARGRTGQSKTHSAGSNTGGTARTWETRRYGSASADEPTVVSPTPATTRAAKNKRRSRGSGDAASNSPDLSMMPDPSVGSGGGGDVRVLPAPTPADDSQQWAQQAAQGYPASPSGSPPDAFAQQGAASDAPAAAPAGPSYYPVSNPVSGQYGSGGSSYPAYTPNAYSADSAPTQANPLRGRHHHGQNDAYPGYGTRPHSESGYSQGQAYTTSDTAGAAQQYGYETAPYAQKTARQYNSGYGGYGGRALVSVHGNLGCRRDDGKYIVGPNDNFCTISQRLYGTDAYFKALAECNRAQFPDENRLRVGDAIDAPEESELVAKYPDLCPDPKRREVIRSRISAASTGTRYRSGSMYTVQEGDTLFDIARYKLGSGTRWPEIFELNSDILQGDFDYVTPGMSLALPGEPSDSVDSVTRRPSPYGFRQ